MDALFLLVVPVLLIAFFVALPLYLLVSVRRLRGELEEIKRQLGGLRRAEPAPRLVAPAAAPEPQPERPAAAPREVAAAPAPPPAAPFLLEAEPQPPAPSRPDLESVLGANWLSKLGVVALAVAAALFLRLAFESGWIGPTARVAIGLVGAGILLGLAQWLLTKPRYRNYAQVLASGGIVILFLSIYAAYDSYHLIGFAPAFTIMAAAAVAASALAVYNETEAVALLCLAGAFATPVLIRGQGGAGGDMLRLYAYLAGLNVWALILIRRRPWHSLTLLTFAATWVLFFASAPGQAPSYLAVEAFAALFAAFSLLGGWRAVQEGREREAERAAQGQAGLGVSLILAGLVLFAIASGIALVGISALALPAFTVVGVALALLLAALALGLPELPAYDLPIRQVFRVLAALALGGLMGLVAVTGPAVTRHQAPAAFGFAVAVYLLFLAVALHMRRQPGAQGIAALLVGANALSHALSAGHALAFVRLWDMPAAALWLPLAALINLGALAIAREEDQRAFRGTVVAVSQALLAVALLLAIAPFMRWPGPAAMAVFLGEFALVSLASLALRRQARRAAFRGDLVAAFGNAAFFFGLLAVSVHLRHFQGLSLLAASALLLAAYHAVVSLQVLRREDDDNLIRLAYLGLALTFITIAIPLQLHASYITLAWAVESAVLVWMGLVAREARFRWYGVALLGLAAFRALVVDIPAGAEPFRFLLNERMLAGAAVAAAAGVAAWLLASRHRELTPGERALPWALVLGANAFALVFVSLDLWQYVGRRWVQAGASAQQLALSLFWSLYALALMAVGIARRARPVRLAAMALLYLSMIKVFTFDLGNLEQAYRILSFLALGVILLVVSLLYTRFENRLKQ